MKTREEVSDKSMLADDLYKTAKSVQIKKIKSFINENSECLKDFRELLEYVASKGKTSVAFNGKQNKYQKYDDYLIKPELTRFVLNNAALIKQATGVNIEITAYAIPWIEISFYMGDE